MTSAVPIKIHNSSAKERTSWTTGVYFEQVPVRSNKSLDKRSSRLPPAANIVCSLSCVVNNLRWQTGHHRWYIFVNKSPPLSDCHSQGIVRLFYFFSLFIALLHWQEKFRKQRYQWDIRFNLDKAYSRCRLLHLANGITRSNNCFLIFILNDIYAFLLLTHIIHLVFKNQHAIEVK